MRTINKIIIHCSDTPEGRETTVEDIRRWHLARNFVDIGYHYVIYIDGSIHQGRKEDVVGAHCTGYNANSIGICYVGGRDKAMKEYKDTRTEAQKASLLSLIKELKKKYPGAKVYGHKDFAAKACPCFDAKSEYAKL